METPKIRYNLKDRGRKHTGQPRAFNIPRLVAEINCDSTQETVATGGMLGYFGHMPRIRYGMNPTEGGIENGRYAPVEPAIVTTYLRAYDDGTVEHKARFIDTASGNLARKLWEERVGGFSSAIDTGKNRFYGFDYVNAPNFINNSFRGVALDDVTQENPLGMTYDDIFAAEVEERQAMMMALIEQYHAERKLLNETLDSVRHENTELLSLVSRHGGKYGGKNGFIRPMLVSRSVDKDVARFRDMNLDSVMPIEKDDDQPRRRSSIVDDLLKR